MKFRYEVLAGTFSGTAMNGAVLDQLIMMAMERGIPLSEISITVVSNEETQEAHS